MERREVIGAGSVFLTGLLGGGLTSGILVHRDAQSRIEEKDDELRSQLTFDRTVQDIDREVELEPQQHSRSRSRGATP